MVITVNPIPIKTRAITIDDKSWFKFSTPRDRLRSKQEIQAVLMLDLLSLTPILMINKNMQANMREY